MLIKYVNCIPLLKDLPFCNFIVKTEFLLKRMTLKETQPVIVFSYSRWLICMQF